MASPNASYAAFNQLTPLGDKVTDTVRYWNEDGFARRDEKRKIAEADDLKKEKADLKKQGLIDKVAKNLSNYDTGSRSLNEIQGQLLQRATDEYAPILKTLEDPNSSDQDKLTAQLKLQEIHNLPEKLKLVTDFYTNQDTAYQTAKQSGAIWENEDYEKSFQGGFEGFILDLDDKGNPMVAFKDTNGDGVVDIKDVQTYEQIQTALNNGQGTFNFQKKFNIEGLTTSIAEKMGTEDITTASSGYKSTQEKQVKKDELKLTIDRLLFKDGEPSDVLKSALREKGLENTVENQKVIRDEIYSITEGKTDYLKKETKKAYPVRSGRSSNTSKSSTGQAVTPTKQTWKGQFENLDTKNYNSVSVEGAKISALETGDGRTLTNANVVNYTYNKSGDLVIDVYHQDEKSSTLSKEKEDLLAQLERLENSSPTDETTKQIKNVVLELSKINKGVANKREVVVVSNEDEASVAQQMGLSIEDMRAQASKQPNSNTESKSDSETKPKEKISW
jgi:hypothetical protein